MDKQSIVCRTSRLWIEQGRELKDPERTRGMNPPLTRARVVLVDVCATGPRNVVRPMVQPSFIRFITAQKIPVMPPDEEPLIVNRIGIRWSPYTPKKLIRRGKVGIYSNAG